MIMHGLPRKSEKTRQANKVKMNIRTMILILVLILSIQVSAKETGDINNNGLVAHWTFDDGSGNIAKDITGNGHDAALKQTEWVTSPRGKALRFSSKESLAQYGNIDSMNLSGDMTLAVWVKTDSRVAPGTERLIFGDVGFTVDRNFNLRMTGSGLLIFDWGDGKKFGVLSAPADLMDGNWRNVVVVASAKDGQATMYVDGEIAASVAMRTPISKAPVKAKERLTGWFWNGFFQGELDDVRLYSRALSGNEVAQLFRSQAGVSIGKAAVLYDGIGLEPKAVQTSKVSNWSKETLRLEISGATLAKREISLKPGEETDVALGEVKLKPIWNSRNELFTCEAPAEPVKVSVIVSGENGTVFEKKTLTLSVPLMLEPMLLVVKDPWQRKMQSGRTNSLEMDVQFTMPAELLRQGVIRIKLVSRETGKEALLKELKSPQARQQISLDVHELPWGAYNMTVSFLDNAGKERVSTKRVATVLPDGPQQIRVLNNLVSELMDARARGQLRNGRIEFMNPREGWVWFSATGKCALQLGNETLLKSGDDKTAVEAMRLLPAGKHVLEISGTPSNLLVRSIPALYYNVYPSISQITPFGQNDWKRLGKHMLPNTNMIETNTQSILNSPEYKEWLAQGKLWTAHVQAPGLKDKKEWTVEKMLDVWLNPGRSTIWPEQTGYTLDKFAGLGVDEFLSKTIPAKTYLMTALSLGRLAEEPAFTGKMWMPFTAAGVYGNPEERLFMKTVLGSGWPYAEEVYLAEKPTEVENLDFIRFKFGQFATGYENNYPGSIRRMIFMPGYYCLPWSSNNTCPQADFRVHLDMQMQYLANDPAFFGLWGVMPYRSNYVDEEILNCMGMLLRHYGIDGKTDRMLKDPYEMKHLTNANFKDGTQHWQTASAEAGGISPGQHLGDSFVIMKRSAKSPNVISQQINGLTPGRLYSLKLTSADYADLKGGVSRKDQQVISIKIEGVKVMEGGFSHPYMSQPVKPFTSEKPFWMTYHWLRFQAENQTARLSISDWAKADAADAPIGQQVMVNFVEVQPALETEK